LIDLIAVAVKVVSMKIRICYLVTSLALLMMFDSSARANGTVGSPGGDCSGQACRDRINNVSVSCDQVSLKASLGSSHNPGGTCGSCYWGGGIAQACGSSATGQAGAE